MGHPHSLIVVDLFAASLFNSTQVGNATSTCAEFPIAFSP
jgi:hypothetical protein